METVAQQTYLFLGLGAANCLLIKNLHEADSLGGKKIVVVEPDLKASNDRTFCFWASESEAKALRLDSMVTKTWSVIGIDSITEKDITPLKYMHIRGIDLYDQTKEVLKLYDVHYLFDYFKGNPEFSDGKVHITSNDRKISADFVFDSRPPEFSQPSNIDSHLLQSFFGWEITTEEAHFEPDKMLMMDFNIPQDAFTQFIYVLPFSDKKALVELTRFGVEAIDENYSNQILESYLDKINVNYQITGKEKGIIPMSTAEIKTEINHSQWIPMGARANMLKSSTGYAFHAMVNDAGFVTQCLSENQIVLRKSKKFRFQMYDRLLLKILSQQGQEGKNIFETLFKKVPMERVLCFLQEKTTPLQDIGILAKLPKWIFIKAALSNGLNRFRSSILNWIPLLLTLIFLLLQQLNLNWVSWTVLLMGFSSIGLSHGALDHLTGKKLDKPKDWLVFIASYLFKGLLFYGIWYFSADAALIIFLIYSLWHFGQADCKEWKLSGSLITWIWGSTLFLIILAFHVAEFTSVLNQIPGLTFIKIQSGEETVIKCLQIGSAVTGILLAWTQKSWKLLSSVVFLLVASKLPLLMSFGLYFVFQHSIHGWNHLKSGLQLSNKNLWVHSLPFNLGGNLLFIFLLLFYNGPNLIGLFFILLSCISVPHVFSMHQYYKDKKI